MTDSRIVTIAIITAILIGAAVLVDPAQDSPNSVGPRFGSGNEIFLFQSYNCSDCHDFTNHTLPEVLDFVLENNGSLIVKNVESSAGFPEEIGHCVWQEFPDQWLDWNRMAFLGSGGNQSTWESMDRLLYATEYNLLLPLPETSRLEKCIYTQDWAQQISLDTSVAKRIKLPAFFSDGKWHPASLESAQAILSRT